jgi:hypothetical protein
VRIEVRPCSDTAEMPPVVAPDADAPTSPPELDTELIVCSSCSTLVAPLFWICSRVITCTGSAVSASIRLIDDPVISTRCICCAADVSCAHAAAGIAAIDAARVVARSAGDGLA